MLNTDVGDLRIKKGSELPANPPAPSAETAPRAPVPPNAPHLTGPKTPAQAVAQ
jgi:hypothetical protein